MNEPDRIMLCRTDRIGDLILSTSCIEPLRRHFPKAQLHFLLRPHLAPLLSGHPALDSVATLPEETLPVAERLAQLEQILGRHDIDTLVLLHPDPLVEQAAGRLEVARRIGYRHAGSKHLTEALPDRRKRGDRHEAACVFDLLERLGVAPPPPPLRASLHVDERRRAGARAKIGQRTRERGYALLHLGAHASKARLPAEVMAAVARWLVDARKLDIVLIGAERDDATLRAFLTRLAGAADRITNLYGETDLAESAWVMAEAAVFVSRDTGPAHLAAAMGCPTLTVFVDPNRHMSSRRWRPLGPRVCVVEKPLRRRLLETDGRYERRYLHNITAADLVAAIETLLAP